MKRILKILGWSAGSVVVLVILFVVGLRLFLPADKLRDLAVARASAALGREVTAQDVKVSLKGGLGVQLSDVSVGNPPGFPAGHLLTAESVDLKLRLRPLFSRQLHADRLVIGAPHISLIKLDAGSNNFTFSAADSSGAAAAGASSPSAGASFNLEQFECNGGFLSFRDEEAGSGLVLTGLRLNWSVTDAGDGQLVSRGRTTSDSLKITGNQLFSVGPVTLDHTARIDPAQEIITLDKSGLRLAELDFAVSAEIDYDPQAPVARAEISGENLELATVLALVPANRAAALDGARTEGNLSLRMILGFDQAQDEPLVVEGSLGLTGGLLALPALAEPITDLAITATFDLDALQVTAGKARTSGVDLEFAGTGNRLRQPDAAEVEGTIHVDADLAGLQPYLPAERQAVLSGRAAGSVRLAGRLDSPRDLLAGGEFTVTDLGYRDADIFEPVTDLDATVTFGPRDLIIRNCSVRMQPSNFTMTGTVQGLVPALLKEAAKPPHLDFTLDSPFFNVDHLFPAASPGAAPLPSEAGSLRSPVIAEFPDFTGSGQVSIAHLIYGGLAFSGITGKVAIAERTVNFSEAVGAVFAGRVTGQTDVDLREMTNPGYRGSFAAEGIEADSLLSRFTPLQGHVFGALDFSGSYSAAGTDPAAFRRSLTLDAQSVMTRGRLVTSGVIQQGLNTLVTKLGRTFDEEEKLKDVAGRVKVAGERVILERFTSEVPGLGTLSLGGSYGFNGDLDLRGDLLLNEDNSRKLLGPLTGGLGGGLTGALDNLLGKKDQNTVSTLRLPITIGGAFTRPVVALDFSALARASGQEVVDELKSKLEGMFRN